MNDSHTLDRHVPKYVRIAEALKTDMARGVLVPGDQLPSFAEMTQQFQVAKHTIDKAHAILEREGLVRREQGRGIFVNHPQSRQMTGSVGIVTPFNMCLEENIAYWALVLTGMRQIARERDYHVLLIDNGAEFTDWEKIDGALLYDIDPQNHYLGAASPPQDFACVLLFNEAPGMPCVTTDDYDCTYQLTRHLIELGHRRIAYLVETNSGLPLLKERKAGYMKALTEAGIEPDDSLTRGLFTKEEPGTLPSLPYFLSAGEHTVSHWLEQGWNDTKCTALIAQNDGVALGAIRAFEAAGLNVPYDVSVVGVDGIPSQMGSIELTTMEIPLREIGCQAMSLLLDKLKNPALTPQSVRLPVRLIKGQTTAPPTGAVVKPELVEA